MDSAPTILTPWRPSEIARALKDRGLDEPSFSSSLKSTRPGDVAAVYETGPDGGIAALMYFNSPAMPHPDMRYAAWGNLIGLPVRVQRRTLLNDALLAPHFRVVQGRKALPPEAAERLKDLIDAHNPALVEPPPADPPPEGWQEYRWAPAGGMDLWGSEDSIQAALHEDEVAWRMLGFADQPAREVHPPGSRDEVDLAGPGLLVECKLRADSRTLAQLDRYLGQFREDGSRWSGWIVAGHSFTPTLAGLCAERQDVRLAACIRDRRDRPLLVEIEGSDAEWPQLESNPAIDLLVHVRSMLEITREIAETAGVPSSEIEDVLDQPEANVADTSETFDALTPVGQIKALLAEAVLVGDDAGESFTQLFDDLDLDYEAVLQELDDIGGEEPATD